MGADLGHVRTHHPLLVHQGRRGVAVLGAHSVQVPIPSRKLLMLHYHLPGSFHWRHVLLVRPMGCHW